MRVSAVPTLIAVLVLAAACGGDGKSLSTGAEDIDRMLHQGDTQALVAAAVAAVSQPGKVFHVRHEQVMAGKEEPSSRAEVWVYADGQAARAEAYGRGGLESVKVIHGEEAAVESEGHIRRETLGPGETGNPAVQALPYMWALGHPAVVFREGELNALPVLVGSAYAVTNEDDAWWCSVIHVYLDKTSLLPLEERHYEGSVVTEPGGEYPGCVETAERKLEFARMYSGAEFVNAAELPQEFFSLDAIGATAMSLRLEAAKKVGFPVYWLGEQGPGDLQLQDIKVIDSATEPARVGLVYSAPLTGRPEPQTLVVLTEGPRHTPLPHEECSLPSTARKVTVEGRQAVLCVGVSRSLRVVFDETKVLVLATAIGDGQGNELNPYNSDEGILQLAERLEPVP